MYCAITWLRRVRHRRRGRTRSRWMCLLDGTIRYIIPLSSAGGPAVCGEPGDGSVLGLQTLADGRRARVDHVSVAADAGEVRRRNVREAPVGRRRVEPVSLSPQSRSLAVRQRRVDRSLTHTTTRRRRSFPSPQTMLTIIDTSGYATWFTAGGAIRIAHYDVIDDVITGKL